MIFFKIKFFLMAKPKELFINSDKFLIIFILGFYLLIFNLIFGKKISSLEKGIIIKNTIEKFINKEYKNEILYRFKKNKRILRKLDNEVIFKFYGGSGWKIHILNLNAYHIQPNAFKNIIPSYICTCDDDMCSEDEYISEEDFQNNVENGYYYFETSSNSLIEFIIRWNYVFERLDEMLYGIESEIESIDFSKFDFSKVTSMQYMFYNCPNIKSIIFNNVNISSLKDINYMFYGCKKLETVNLFMFNNLNLVNIDYVFSNCESLKSLNLSNFHVNIKQMISTFENCTSLETLDISNLNCSEAENVEKVLTNCNNLKFINLENFKESKSSNKILSTLSDGFSFENLTVKCNEKQIFNVNEKICENLEITIYHCKCIPKGTSLGIFINNEIIELKSENSCFWNYNIEKAHLSDFKFIIFKKTRNIIIDLLESKNYNYNSMKLNGLILKFL